MRFYKMFGVILAFASVMCFATAATGQTTYYVDCTCGNDAWTGTDPCAGEPDGPKATIQAAIDDPAVVNGDEIVVAPCTYNETINFNGKAITLRSSGGPDGTTIDGTSLDDSVVKCVSGEGPDTVLEGFTITGGTGNTTLASPGDAEGGGMLNINSSPTVSNCVFDDNHVAIGGADGGGMANWNNSSPRVTDCMFTGNTADGVGGGMYNTQSSSPIVENCFFIENTGENLGGGMGNVHDSSPEVTDCVFTANTTINHGGGMDNRDNSSPSVRNCVFVSNQCSVSDESTGGGMSNSDTSSPSVVNCLFMDNEAPDGGGMANNYSNPELTNCMFIGNAAIGGSALTNGGGMINGASDPVITNCTFFGNTAERGAGIRNDAVSAPTVKNCIFWDNTTGQISGGAPDVTYSCIQDGYPGACNIDENPQFADSDGRLSAGSPCIDAGDNAAVTKPTDLDGNPRFVDDPCTDDCPHCPDPANCGDPPIVDMGAYEFQAAPDADCDGVPDADDVCPNTPPGLSIDCEGRPRLDLNNDCQVNGLDIQLIVDQLLSA